MASITVSLNSLSGFSAVTPGRIRRLPGTVNVGLNSLSGFSAVTPLQRYHSPLGGERYAKSQFPVGFLGCYANEGTLALDMLNPAGSSQFPVGFLGCYAAVRTAQHHASVGCEVSIPCRVSRLLRQPNSCSKSRRLNLRVSIPCRVSRLLRLCRVAFRILRL